MNTPKIGDRISNGAVIIDLKRAWDPTAWMALCLWTEDQQQIFPTRRTSDLYVTWKIYPDPDGLVTASNGHYHDTLSDSVVDFNSRV